MLKLTTKQGKVIEIRHFQPEHEEVIEDAFKRIPEKLVAESDEELRVTSDQTIPFRDILSLERVKEMTVGLHELLPLCSEEFVMEMYKKGLVK